MGLERRADRQDQNMKNAWFAPRRKSLKDLFLPAISVSADKRQELLQRYTNIGRTATGSGTGFAGGIQAA